MLPVLVLASVLHDGVVRDVAVEREIEVAVGDRVELRVVRQQPGAIYRLEGLPLDARAEPVEGGIDVRWSPRDAEVGAYDLVVDVKLGDDEEQQHVRVVVNERGHQLLVPGAVAALFVPNDPKTLGAFAGGGAELVLYSFADQGSLFVPSHGRFFLDAFALASSRAATDPLFSVSLGFDLTLERSPGRRYLLPFVGAEAGFAYQTQIGAFGWAMPLVGVYPWASRAARVALEGGYLLPTTAAHDVRGLVVMASIDLAPF